MSSIVDLYSKSLSSRVMNWHWKRGWVLSSRPPGRRYHPFELVTVRLSIWGRPLPRFRIKEECVEGIVQGIQHVGSDESGDDRDKCRLVRKDRPRRFTRETCRKVGVTGEREWRWRERKSESLSDSRKVRRGVQDERSFRTDFVTWILRHIVFLY